MKRLIAALVFVTACAHAHPSQELLDARAAYAQAEASPAQALAPADLHTAREALDVAEKSYKHESKDARDFAYVALRKAERAEAMGNAAAAGDAKSQAAKDKDLTQQQIIAQQRAQSAEATAQLRNTEGALAASDNALMAQKAQTEAERQARLAAEQKAKDAMDALAKSLEVKNDVRGMVITLSGGVVFATNQATILPNARAQLDQVADALKTQAEHHFSVEGHTDNQGTDAVNDDLSARRANAVKDYLISRGVAAATITSQGFGSHKPVAENRTPEGRAMNRRVEIIIDKPVASAER